MTDTTSGSFSQFNPAEVMERIDVHLERINIIREDTKSEWFSENRDKGKSVGFWPFRKTIRWKEEELEKLWKEGDTGWYWDSPKYDLWDQWNTSVKNFERIRDFCQLAIDAGNKTVNLSKEDALFAYNWS